MDVGISNSVYHTVIDADTWRQVKRAAEQQEKSEPHLDVCKCDRVRSQNEHAQQARVGPSLIHVCMFICVQKQSGWALYAFTNLMKI